jgi:hypothetical protein
MNAETSQLIYELAICANPQRFFPFPTYFRNNRKLKPTDDYTIDEYKSMEQVLPLVNPANLQLTSAEAIALYETLYEPTIELRKLSTPIIPDIIEYQFKYNPIEERLKRIELKKNSTPTHYLFHGSDKGNWYSILKNGVKNMSNTKFQTHGAVLGAGIYCTTQLSIAMSYGKYIAVLEVTGDIEPFKKGSAVYVIKTDLIRPRYLLKTTVSAYINVDTQLVLEKYKLHTFPTYKVISDKRLETEKACLKAAFPSAVFEVTPDKQNITFEYLRHKILIYIDDFPIVSPMFYVFDLEKYSEQVQNHFTNSIYTIKSDDWSPIMKLASAVEKVISLL